MSESRRSECFTVALFVSDVDRHIHRELSQMPGRMRPVASMQHVPSRRITVWRWSFRRERQSTLSREAEATYTMEKYTTRFAVLPGVSIDSAGRVERWLVFRSISSVTWSFPSFFGCLSLLSFPFPLLPSTTYARHRAKYMRESCGRRTSPRRASPRWSGRIG